MISMLQWNSVEDCLPPEEVQVLILLQERIFDKEEIEFTEWMELSIGYWISYIDKSKNADIKWVVVDIDNYEEKLEFTNESCVINNHQYYILKWSHLPKVEDLIINDEGITVYES